MGQLWEDLVLWELMLNAHPELRAIVEIGTWKGGMARYLHAQAEARGMDFVTYDVFVPAAAIPGFVQCDVFANPEVVLAYVAEREPLVLLCDGGNKPRELATFATALHRGSVAVVHDWLTETMPDDVPDGLTEVYGEFCDQIGSMSRVFEVAA